MYGRLKKQYARCSNCVAPPVPLNNYLNNVTFSESSLRNHNIENQSSHICTSPLFCFAMTLVIYIICVLIFCASVLLSRIKLQPMPMISKK